MGIPDILKLVGLLIAASSAIIGTLRQTKDEETGKLTAAGKWILACAIGGLGISVVTQVFESYGALESASNQLRRHEQILRGLTRFNRLSVVCDFDSSVSEASLLGPQPFTLQVVFMRSGISELIIEATAAKSTGEVGYVSVTGPVQYARTPLSETDTAFSSRGFNAVSSGKSFWIRLWTKDIAQRLDNDRRFIYWPYESLGDFKDVGVHVAARGTVADRLKSVVLRFNEDLIVEVPVEHSVAVWRLEDIFSSFRSIANINSALHTDSPKAARQ